jgi:acetyl esterase/lipase
MKTTVLLLLAALHPAASALSQETGAVESHRNLPYAGNDNPRQKLDLYLPKERNGKPLPVLVFIHGGGWKVGGKGNGEAVTAFVAGGQYGGVSIGYRLTDEASWPAQIHDCKAAIRWIHANAARHGLDARRIGVFGTSAGGHLVAMLGTTIGNKELEGDLGPHVGSSSAVTCVVDFFGPTELLTMGGWHDNPGSPEAMLVGGTLQETKGCRQPGLAHQSCFAGRRALLDPPRHGGQNGADCAVREVSRRSAKGRSGVGLL